MAIRPPLIYIAIAFIVNYSLKLVNIQRIFVKLNSRALQFAVLSEYINDEANYFQSLIG